MESELLRNELQNVRNHLTTLTRNIDNTLITYNQNRNNTTSNPRRNLNNLFSELRNLYPHTNYNPTRYNERTNINSTQNINNLGTHNQQDINNNREYIRNLYSNLFNNPDMVEVTLFDNGRRVVNNMEDVQIHPSLRTLRESSSIHLYKDLDTNQETCSICRENFQDLSVVRKLRCNHIFHMDCVDSWFETNIRCPLCRIDLRNENEEDETQDEVE